MNGNPVHFYAEDGSGFKFIGECLIDIDARNPQLAARMALPLTRVAQYAPQRQNQMRWHCKRCKTRHSQKICVRLSTRHWLTHRRTGDTSEHDNV